MPAQTFPIAGLHCQSCVTNTGEHLRAHDAITAAEVSLNPPEVKLETTRPLTAEEVNAWLAPLKKYRVSEPVEAPKVAATGAESSAEALPAVSPVTYKPLIILLLFLLAVTGATQVSAGMFHAESAMRIFMGGFFIAFSFFKFLDLPGFASAYRGYDLVAKAWPGYGYVYPFLEFGLGLAYVANWQPFVTNVATAVLMAVSLAGVLKAVLSKRQIRCACLGTVFNLPMSTVTIIEDGVMLVMAVITLL